MTGRGESARPRLSGSRVRVSTPDLRVRRRGVATRLDGRGQESFRDRQVFWGMVEAVGIEPTSEKPSPRALRACPSFFISSSRAGRRHPIAKTSPAKLRGRREATPTVSIYFDVVPMSAADQGSSPARADLIKPQGRSCRWQLSRFPFDEWRLGTLPTNCMTTRRIQGAPSCKRTASHATTSSIFREFLTAE